MRGQKAFLIVQQAADLPFYTSTVVDMISIWDDIGTPEGMVEAIHREYERLRKRYPAGQYQIDEVYADAFPPLSQEAHFLSRREIKQKHASQCMQEV